MKPLRVVKAPKFWNPRTPLIGFGETSQLHNLVWKLRWSSNSKGPSYSVTLLYVSVEALGIFRVPLVSRPVRYFIMIALGRFVRQFIDSEDYFRDIVTEELLRLMLGGMNLPPLRSSKKHLFWLCYSSVCIQGCAIGGRGGVAPPNIFKFARKLSKVSWPQYFPWPCFVLVTIVGQLGKTPPPHQQKVSQHIAICTCNFLGGSRLKWSYGWGIAWECIMFTKSLHFVGNRYFANCHAPWLCIHSSTPCDPCQEPV